MHGWGEKEGRSKVVRTEFKELEICSREESNCMQNIIESRCSGCNRTNDFEAFVFERAEN